MRKNSMKYINGIVVLVLVVMTLVSCGTFKENKKPTSVEGGLHVEESVDSIDSETYVSSDEE